MIQVFPSGSRYVAQHGWLTSRFSFSFAEYYDLQNTNFGVLRVFNDDTVQPGQGFPKHPHAEMEIMSYVISGELEHQDSMGNRSILHTGEVQVTTAGSGIQHSEYNPSLVEPVHFLQLWFFPNQSGLNPTWEQRSFAKSDRLNRLLPVVSGAPEDTDALFIHQDVTVYLSDVSAGKTLVHSQSQGRKIYLFVISGEIFLNENQQLERGDSARITELGTLSIKAGVDSEVLLIDLV